ncbi:MAG: hypothetical protein WCH11_03445 [Bdellovibrio sp.]
MMALFFLLLGGSSPVWSALPPAIDLLQRIVENSGNTGFVIEQEVSLPTDSGLFSFRETWWVESEDKISVQIRAPGFLQNTLFQNAQKISPNSSKQSWIDPVERIFHFRKSERLGEELIRQGILVAASVQKKNIGSLKDITYRADPRLRLARVGGQAVLALGIASSVDKSEPGLWIDPENFALRKYRNSLGTEVTAEHHSLFSGGLYFPKLRSYRWDQQSAQIQVVKVESRPFSRMKITPSEKENKIDFSQIPESQRSTFQNFLQRFR